MISISSDKMEFISIGGLLSGLELDDIMAGVSACRNQNRLLADRIYTGQYRKSGALARRTSRIYYTG